MAVYGKLCLICRRPVGFYADLHYAVRLMHGVSVRHDNTCGLGITMFLEIDLTHLLCEDFSVVTLYIFVLNLPLKKILRHQRCQ